MGSSLVKILKVFLISIMILLFQIIITSIFITIYLFTNNIFIVFMIPIVEIVIGICVKNTHYYKTKNIFFSWIISLLFLIGTILYMVINHSLLGVFLFLAIHILGFGFADFFHIILSIFKRKRNTGDGSKPT